MKIGDDTTVVAAAGQLAGNLGEEVVIAGVSTGRFYGLNEVASRVWQLIQKPMLFGELKRALSEEYDAPPERLAADLVMLIERMHNEKLIEVTNA